jgi:hypothetical protein
MSDLPRVCSLRRWRWRSRTSVGDGDELDDARELAVVTGIRGTVLQHLLRREECRRRAWLAPQARA